MKGLFYFLNVFVLFVFTNIQYSSAQEEVINQDGFQFDTLSIISATSVKSQHKSGTCWSYGTSSFIEAEILRISNKDVNLSEMYFVYQAYLDKADSYVRLHGTSNFGAGGQAHDVMNMIRKYGMLTESDYQAYISGFDNHVHAEMDNVLNGFVENVVKNPSSKLSSAWKNAFKSLLNSYLGDPSSKLETAKKNVKQYNINPDDYIEISSYMYKPYYQKMRLEVPDNWSFDLYYNIPLDELMGLMKSAITNGYSICWDGDVSNKGFSHRNAVAILPETQVENLSGSEQSKWESMTTKELFKNMYSFESPVPEMNVTEELRQTAFDNYTATDDHLMHLTGLLKDQNGTYYYVTKNSWAANSNKNGGYLNMSESYLRMNTLAIMVHKDALSKKLRNKLGL